VWVVVEAVVIQHGLLCDVLELRESCALELILSEGEKEEWFVTAISPMVMMPARSILTSSSFSVGVDEQGSRRAEPVLRRGLG